MQGEEVGTGLLTYPVLMAADILLYQVRNSLLSYQTNTFAAALGALVYFREDFSQCMPNVYSARVSKALLLDCNLSRCAVYITCGIGFSCYENLGNTYAVKEWRSVAVQSSNAC